MSCSLCEPESRADGALAAQELNQLINAVAEAPANTVATARPSPTSSNSTDYLARTTSAPAFQILEILPATAPPRTARGRTDAAEAVGYADLAPTKLAALTSHIKTPPPPPPICYSTTCSASTAKEIRPLANRSNFVSGHFLAEKTYLVGY
jgi:hypothetical protein